MAISSLDDVVAGFQPPTFYAKALGGTMVAGRHHSFWPIAGAPGAGGYDTSLNGANLSSSSSLPAGALPHTDPVSGNAHLGRLTGICGQNAMLLLVDRLWQNRLTINSTAAQNITQPTLPARDRNGSTDGDGVLLAVEVSAATAGTAATVTATYTNQAGTGSRTANFTMGAPTGTAGAIGAWFPIGLQAGDTGVRSVQTIQFGTAWATGTINLVAYRVIAALELVGAFIPGAVDALTSGLPRLYDGSVLHFVLLPTATTSTGIAGTFTETQG